MTEETNEENSTIEKLESVGQIILGEMEKLGGILTGDPISQAEGELTEDVGTVHLETAEDLEESETEESEPTE